MVFAPSSLEAHTPLEGELQSSGIAEKMAGVTEIQVEVPPRLAQNQSSIRPQPLSPPESPISPLPSNPFQMDPSSLKEVQICSMCHASRQLSDQDANLDVGDPCGLPVANGFRRYRSPVIVEKDTREILERNG